MKEKKRYVCSSFEAADQKNWRLKLSLRKSTKLCENLPFAFYPDLLDGLKTCIFLMLKFLLRSQFSVVSAQLSTKSRFRSFEGVRFRFANF